MSQEHVLLCIAIELTQLFGLSVSVCMYVKQGVDETLSLVEFMGNHIQTF